MTEAAKVLGVHYPDPKDVDVNAVAYAVKNNGLTASSKKTYRVRKKS
jgi:hypothetical protein